MHPKAFNYHQPRELSEALTLLDELGETGTPYAGGTELLLMLKLRMVEYDDLINLKRIGGLDGIEVKDGVLSIGALTTHARIAADELVQAHCPTLAMLCGSIANARVRAAGTIGGNICFAEPRADPPVLLAALKARYVLNSTNGSRVMPADGFILGPFETRREENEVLTAIEIPLDGRRAYCARIEAGNHSLATAALAIGPETVLRLGYGVGALLSLRETEAYLAESLPEPDIPKVKEIVEAETREVDVPGDIEAGEAYRRHLMGVAVARAVLGVLAADEERKP